MELTTIQIALIAALVLILPIGIYGNVRRAKKKKFSEDDFSEYRKAQGEFSNSNIKDYILNNKNSYPRDSIKNALINSGYAPDEVEKYLKEFF